MTARSGMEAILEANLFVATQPLARERRLIRISGGKAVVGNPFLYGTTREFLMHFGLRSLKDLPPLEEFEETFGADLSSGGGFGSGAELRLDEQRVDESWPAPPAP